MKSNCLLSFIPLAALACPFSLAAQEAADSVHSSISLEEVVVVGERAWIEGNKAIFVPTKSEKNLSDSPSSLVERMHIPTVIVDRGQIKSLAGQDVAIFINGVQADGIDLSTFWPKQTIRVEYLDHPADPVYKGLPAVLNFVMEEYEVGGVTRVTGSQTFPNSGNYNVSSKLVYKKMTYGLTLGGGYRRNHSACYSGTRDYHDIYYGGEHFDMISNLLSGHSYSRSENLAAAMNARYRSDKSVITHTVGLKYDHNPGSGNTDADGWNPQLFDSHSSFSRNTSHSLSPEVSGQYFVSFNPKWSMNLGWGYTYSHVNQASLYQAENLEAILNSSRGTTNSGDLAAALQYTVNPAKLAMALMLNSHMDRFSTEYSGSTTTRNLQWNGNTTATLGLRWMASEKVFVAFDPGLLVNYWHLFGGDIYTDVRPKLNANVNYSPTRYFNMYGSVACFWYAPSASQSGDVTIREDELTWLLSNDALKGHSTWMTDLYCNWMPRNDFRLSLSTGYTRSDNDIISTYRAADAEMGGVLKTFENAGPQDTFSLDVFINKYFFNNKLNIHLQPTYRYSKYHGRYSAANSWFRMRGSASYTFGNFDVSVVYGGPERWMTDGGMGRGWHADQWDLGLSYGNGDLYMNLSVNNIFHSHSKYWNEVNGGAYTTHMDRFDTGRSVSLRVTYTFGYGKKVDRNIDIQGPSGAKSAILSDN